MMYYRKNSTIGVFTAMITAVLFLSVIHVNAQQKTEICNKNILAEVGNGYHYELWTAGGGDVCMTVMGEDAKFKVTWKNINNMVARIGLKYDETKTADQLGTFTADYTFKKSGVTGMSFIGVYGWMVNPLVEYYIVEDWGKSRPGYSKKSTVTIDGAQYDIMTDTRKNKPSIKGNATFTQWWSVRKTRRQSGHISVSQHFDAWKKVGAQLGGLYEVKLKAEGYKSSGTVEFTEAKVELNKQDKPTNVSFVPEILREQHAPLTNRNYPGKILLIALNGTVIKSMQWNGSEPPVIATDNLVPGVYFIQSCRDGNPPVIKPLHIK